VILYFILKIMLVVLENLYDWIWTWKVHKNKNNILCCFAAFYTITITMQSALCCNTVQTQTGWAVQCNFSFRLCSLFVLSDAQNCYNLFKMCQTWFQAYLFTLYQKERKIVFSITNYHSVELNTPKSCFCLIWFEVFVICT